MDGQGTHGGGRSFPAGAARRRGVSLLLLLTIASVFAMSGPALAAGCKHHKCERDNGNHYGQERHEGDNGNHYGQDRSGPRPTPGPTRGADRTIRGSGVSSASAPTSTSGAHSDGARGDGPHRSGRRSGGKAKVERRESLTESPPIAFRTALKHLPTDPAPGELSGSLGRRGAGLRELAWEPAAVPQMDPLDLVASAVDSARALAFPLSLTLAVSAFLLLQGRIDRRDPKLAVWREEMAQFD